MPNEVQHTQPQPTWISIAMRMRNGGPSRVTMLESLEKIGSFLLVMGGYAAINRLEAYLASKGLLWGHSPSTRFDDMIPFSPIWTYPYFTLWVGMVAPFFWIATHRYFRRMYLGYVGLLLVAYPIFWLYPTTIVRPNAPELVHFHDFLYASLLSGDAPFNLLPSLHNALSQFTAWSIWTLNRRAGAVAWVWAAATSLSTLPVKQHFIADVVTGSLLAFAAWYVTLRPLAKELDLGRDDHRSDRVFLIPLALQLLMFVVLYWQHASA